MTPAGFEPLSAAELHLLLRVAVVEGRDDFASRIANRILDQREERRRFLAATQFIERKKA